MSLAILVINHVEEEKVVIITASAPLVYRNNDKKYDWRNGLQFEKFIGRRKIREQDKSKIEKFMIKE